MKAGAGGAGRSGGGARRGRRHLQGAGARDLQMFTTPRGRGEKFTPPPPPARASFRFEVSWLRTGVEGGKCSSLGLLIFTSRPLCSYFGRNKSYKGSLDDLLTTQREGTISHQTALFAVSMPPRSLIRNVYLGPVPLGRRTHLGKPFRVLSFFQRTGWWL